MDQRALVERAKRGDHEAFAVLVAAVAPRQLGAACLIVRDLELAHDATQDALVRAWRDLPGLREPDRFDAWLHRLTVNACLDLLRRKRRRATEVELIDLEIPGPMDPATGIVDRDALDDALARLDADARAIVVLHYRRDQRAATRGGSGPHFPTVGLKASTFTRCCGMLIPIRRHLRLGSSGLPGVYAHARLLSGAPLQPFRAAPAPNRASRPPP